MKKVLFLLMIVLPALTVAAQQNLPVTVLSVADTSKPLLFYISGDGGMNKFSSAVLQSFHKKGYGIVGLNSRSYFWEKKEPQKAAAELSQLIGHYLKEWKRSSFVLIGYSFGADVSPFIFRHFAPELAANCRKLVLISPSSFTQFEVKLSGMLGSGSKSGNNVPAEINKVSKPVLILMGKEEKDFPLRQVASQSKEVLLLNGGHHYNDDTNAVSTHIIDRIR